MAKAFSDNEKCIIKEKLHNGVVECIKKYGIRKTTVDELASYAGISKGAFYLFYETKERLFYEVIMVNHDLFQAYLFDALQNQRENLTVDCITEVCFTLIKENREFWTALLTGGEMEYLYRKLPEEVWNDHSRQDTDFIGRLTEILPIREDADISIVVASLRAVFLSMLNVQTIGEKEYEEVVRILLRGVLLQFLN